MKEDLILALIKELWKLDVVQHEYQDNDNYYSLISEKDGDTLTIKITLKEQEEDEDFLLWVDMLDDDIYIEALEILEEDGINFAEAYKNHPKEAKEYFIHAVKIATNEKIKELRDSIN